MLGWNHKIAEPAKIITLSHNGDKYALVPLHELYSYVSGFEKRGHLEQNKSFCYHFEADNQRSTTEFESSQYLIWLWSYSCLKMYMPVHFV
jgi:hypothetical protein